jgi:tRNA nucleotidyltransferase (CCA-adding enzyme)
LSEAAASQDAHSSAKAGAADTGTASPAIPSHIELPTQALTAIRLLENAGYEAWCVGGFVRDALRGCPPDDVDLATSSIWTDTERVITEAGYPVEETGTAHGTVTAIIDGCRLEITTYRTDGTYSDGRHPDSVTFVSSIEEDLARRDFTMNAIAYHTERGLLDPYGGIDDLRRGVIRAVGEPLRRFDEDALRILRGCRFASQLGFDIDDATRFAMWKDKTKLMGLAPERLTVEMTKLLLGDHVHDTLMTCGNILAGFLPEIVAMEGFEQNSKYHIYDVWEHTAYVVQNTPATPLCRWTALFHDMGKPASAFTENGCRHFYNHPRLSVVIARGILKRLTLPHRLCEQILLLVRMHDVHIEPTDRSVKRALVRLDNDVDLMRALLDVKRADALSQEPHFGAARLENVDALRKTLARVVEEQQAFRLTDLKISGHDLIEAGFPQGPEIGKVLREALDAVIDGKVENERAALLAFALDRRDA